MSLYEFNLIFFKFISIYFDIAFINFFLTSAKTFVCLEYNPFYCDDLKYLSEAHLIV
jgi:hypothetical protein